MTDDAFRELLASYEAALEAARRSTTLARTLAEGYRSSQRPPEDVIEAYLARINDEEAKLAELRNMVTHFKFWFRTH
jgi:hypothetical protein